MVRKIENVVKDILNVQKSAPIGMEWRIEERTGSTQSENCETSKERKDQCLKGSKDNSRANSEQGRVNGAPENLAVLQPKRLCKVPMKRS
jgi:hypothetical protein